VTGATVYLIDDEDAVRRSLKLLLRTLGWKAQAFETGAAFLAALDTLPPACTLLDIRMPGIDGLEVQRELARRNRAMPVVVMTGHGDIATAVAALTAGAADFIEKPFDRVRLMQALERARLKLEDPAGYETLRQGAAATIAEMPPTDRGVLDAFAQGLSNQGVASLLELSLSEVEMIRARLVERLDGTGIADVVRIAHLAAPNIVSTG
jgi:two-component system response regulator FixJ